MVKEYSDEKNKYEKFMDAVKEMITGYVGEEYSVDIRPITKNNGCIYYGLSIIKPGNTITPTIYLESFYENYRKGVGLSHIVDEILHVNEINSVTNNGELEFFFDYCKVKERLTIKLINYNDNIELLEDVPHKRFLDLAIIACVEAMIIDGNWGTVTIRNNHICMWGIKGEQVIDDAIENSENIHPAVIRQLADIIDEIIPDDDKSFIDGYDEEMRNYGKQMTVVTNNIRINGAAVIAYPDMVNKLYKALGTEYYVIPSSVHELIVIRKNGKVDARTINFMIEDVNNNEVAIEDRLSNHVYEYDANSDTLIPVYTYYQIQRACE